MLYCFLDTNIFLQFKMFDDIDVWLHFPEGITVFEEEFITPDPPKAPELPQHQSSIAGLSYSSRLLASDVSDMSLSMPINLSKLSFPSTSPKLTIQKTDNDYEIDYYRDNLKHYQQCELKLYINFEVPLRLPTGFEVDYTITVGNLINQIEGKLTIKLE